MHQPEYREFIGNEFKFPWVYLHGIKDYLDMAVHLENEPEARAVINFSPVLLEQLMEYEEQINACLKGTGPIRDPLLALLDNPVFPADNEHRVAIIKDCMRSNQQHQIERFVPYQKLIEIAEMVIHDEHHSAYLSNQFLADLVTWYHLVWLGETVRRTDKRVQDLIKQGTGYTLHQRKVVLEIIAELITSLRSRYKSLADQGRIELSMSPYAHPMIPLLLDFESARMSIPDIHLPGLKQYPGGRERAEWHMQKGLELFESYFSERPVGCWPSEGGVSDDTARLIEESGFQWIATGENVLQNSINESNSLNDDHSIYHGFTLPESNIRLYGRDDTLSDLIGFTYSSWHADDAAGDLVHRLETIADQHENKKNMVVSIIMDGENAWEYYPENGYYFLPTLYKLLVDSEKIKLCTYKELQKQKPVQLEQIVAGSWVFGTFSTWIGDEDKNRAWDILGDVKRICDEVCAKNDLDPELRQRIEKQLAICEGSDWFWWFGDYNPAETVSDFERLFRTHVVNLYHLLAKEPPQYLSQTLSHGSGSPELGGVIRPGKREHHS